MAAQIQSLTFADEGVVVGYIEDDEFDKPVMKLEQLSIPGEPFRLEIDEVLVAVRELVDAALLARRNPPPRFEAPR